MFTGIHSFLLKCRVAKLPPAEMESKQRNLVCLQNVTPIRLHSFFTISLTLKAKCRRLVLEPWEAVFFCRSLNARRIFSDWASTFEKYVWVIHLVFLGDGKKTTKPNTPE